MQAGCPFVSVQSFNWAVHVIQMVSFGCAVVRCCWLSSDLLIQFKKSISACGTLMKAEKKLAFCFGLFRKFDTTADCLDGPLVWSCRWLMICKRIMRYDGMLPFFIFRRLPYIFLLLSSSFPPAPPCLKNKKHLLPDEIINFTIFRMTYLIWFDLIYWWQMNVVFVVHLFPPLASYHSAPDRA